MGLSVAVIALPRLGFRPDGRRAGSIPRRGPWSGRAGLLERRALFPRPATETPAFFLNMITSQLKLRVLLLPFVWSFVLHL